MIVLIRFFFTIFQMDLVEMDLDLDEISQKNGSLRACPHSVLALGRGDTPLHRAAANGKTAVVELLLAANATGGCAKRLWPGASVRTRPVRVLLGA